MNDKLNFTYLALGGYVEVMKYSYLYFFVTLALYLFIIFSNVSIVYVIWTHQNLHEPMYIFIAALSLNSLFFSTAIYPKLLINSLSDKQIVSLQASDFLLLAAMAFDRYVSICKPLLYPTILRKKTITALLFLSWFLPVCSSVCPAILIAKEKLCNFTLRGIFCNNSLLKLHCVRSTIMLIYGLIGLMNFGVLPVLFILFTYMKILVISYRSSRVVRKKAAETCIPHLLVLISFSLLAAYDIISQFIWLQSSQNVQMIHCWVKCCWSPEITDALVTFLPCGVFHVFIRLDRIRMS
uniref:G-protein coupled receptors family 1 profile domain-containing protein n=1 Tax=Salarias fasciatus TaxID=181472 RepID=A0A672GVM8_SALFA